MCPQNLDPAHMIAGQSRGLINTHRTNCEQYFGLLLQVDFSNPGQIFESKIP